MEGSSIFMNKAEVPNTEALQKGLKESFLFWENVVLLTFEHYPKGKPEWNFPGKKYGWSFRIKDKRRAILYLLPHDGYFQVAFIFGDKAVNEIQASDIPEDLKTELAGARKYAEGRGIQIDIHDDSDLPTISKLIAIKLKF